MVGWTMVICEGHGFDQGECETVGSCFWNAQFCWSGVGQGHFGPIGLRALSQTKCPLLTAFFFSFFLSLSSPTLTFLQEEVIVGFGWGFKSQKK